MTHFRLGLTALLVFIFSISASAQKRDSNLVSYLAQTEPVQTLIEPAAYCYFAPNVMVSESYLLFNSYVNETYELTIRDERGQKLMTYAGQAAYGDNKITVSRNNLPAGRYNYLFRTSTGKMKSGLLFIID